MAFVKNVQQAYQKASAMPSKTVTSIEAFQVGSMTVIEMTATDGTQEWVSDRQGVLTVSKTKPY